MSDGAQQPLLDGEGERSRSEQVNVDVNRLINGDDAGSDAHGSQNDPTIPSARHVMFCWPYSIVKSKLYLCWQ